MADKKEQEPKDLFSIRESYPDAESIFAFLPKPLDEIKDDCYVVMDTNALLVPYTAGRDSLEQIRKTLQGIIEQKRLVIPGHVAREFAKNRPQKLHDLHQQLMNAKNIKISHTEYPLLEGMEEHNRVQEAREKLEQAVREYQRALKNLLERVEGWFWRDPVSLMYSELFTSDVVVDPEFNAETLQEDMDRRQQYDIPPGYKDSSKSKNQEGDLIIWKTILEVGKAHKKDVLFVSLEKKPDWWNQGSSNQPLYPRYELIDEFRRYSEGQSFHIVKFSQFLELYGATEEVVQEIRKEERHARNRLVHMQSMGSLESKSQAVMKWLQNQYLDSRFDTLLEHEVCDIIITTPEGLRIGFEIKFTQGQPHYRGIYRWLATTSHSIDHLGLDQVILIFVVDNEIVVDKLIDVFREHAVSDMSLIIGYVDVKDEFQVYREIDGAHL
jgi:rRNA-processing protein FCF1